MIQDKQEEVEFFDAHATNDDYNVFSEEANKKLIDSFVRLSRLGPGATVLDLGCGSGIFTYLLSQRGFEVAGLDISPKLLELARRKYPGISFIEGDVEVLPCRDASVDGVLFSGLLHHLPDPATCASETFRVLKPNGCFVAFDPNRANPFMYLYRDRSSPLYSSNGVTRNERPVRARDAVMTFEAAGFKVAAEYISGLPYRYVASRLARAALPIYNTLDNLLFWPSFMRPFSPFVLIHGVKP